METFVNGMRIHYTDIGQGAAILVLHGWGSNIAVHRAMIAQLSARYRVLALDLPGFGKSQEPPVPFNVDDYADTVLEFLKPFALPSLTLIGHSFGGRIIIKLANRTLPFRIDRIVLIDSAGIRPAPTRKGLRRQKTYKFCKRVLSLKPMRSLFPNALESLRKRHGSADYNAASPMMRQCLVRVVNEDLTALLPGIQPETLLIWGENDTATPISDARLMEKTIPHAGLAVIQNAGHFSFLDQPFVFSRILASFFGLE